MNEGRGIFASRVPALDGLRGIAILAVMLFHFRWIFDSGSDAISRGLSAGLSFGWMGVDLFFALSGFLITGILLETRDSSSYFRAFYGRRSLRIFPLFYLTLLLVLGAGPVISRAWGHQNLWGHINPLWYLLYAANWQPGFHGLMDPMVGHFWSLCVEEQFYLVWPMLVWLTPPRWLPRLALLLAVFSLLLRFVLLQSGGGGEGVYRMTLTRMDGLALGSWVAIANRDPEMRQWLHARVHTLLWMSLAGIVGTILVQRGFDPDSAAMQYTGYLFLGIFFAAIVHLAANASGSFARALAWRPLLIAGTFSYAMYVFHIPLERMVRPVVGRIAASLPLPAALALRTFYVVAMVAIMFGIGWLSWNLFEKHLLKLKRHFPYHAPNFELPLSGATVMEPDKALRAAGSNRP